MCSLCFAVAAAFRALVHSVHSLANADEKAEKDPFCWHDDDDVMTNVVVVGGWLDPLCGCSSDE